MVVDDDIATVNVAGEMNFSDVDGVDSVDPAHAMRQGVTR